MTKEDKIKAYAMRLDGASFQQIADEFGVTRQYIHQVITKPGGRDRPIRRYIYPNIAIWMHEKRHSAKALAADIQVSQQCITKILKGKGNPSKQTIDRILEVTGMTYEQAFFQDKEMKGEQK